MTKKEARLLAKERLNSLNQFEKSRRSLIVREKIMNLEVFKNAKLVALYAPLNNEVNLLDLLKQDKKFCFPKINALDEIDFIYVDEKTLWGKNRFNINEPKSGKIVIDRIDLMLIPSLARNEENTRLGYGGGYYDKFLAKNIVNEKIGILLENNILNFKTDNFDIKLDMFLTSEE